MPEPQHHHLQSRTEQGILVLTPTDAQIRSDELADALRDELLAAVAPDDVTGVVLDLRNVTFFSSVAFRPLLHLHSKLKERNGRVVLCHVAPVIGEVLHLTRMVSSSGSFRAPFEQQADVAGAVASLKGTAPPK